MTLPYRSASWTDTWKWPSDCRKWHFVISLALRPFLLRILFIFEPRCTHSLRCDDIFFSLLLKFLNFSVKMCASTPWLFSGFLALTGDIIDVTNPCLYRYPEHYISLLCTGDTLVPDTESAPPILKLVYSKYLLSYKKVEQTKNFFLFVLKSVACFPFLTNPRIWRLAIFQKVNSYL